MLKYPVVVNQDRMAHSASEIAKELSALAAVELVNEGATIAIGSGSTVDKAIRALGRKFEGSTRKPSIVAASKHSEQLVEEARLPLRNLDQVSDFSLMLDGADEVAPDLTLIKGGGGALTREKLLATMAERLIIMVDFTKIVHRIGEHSLLPVEVIPFAAPYVGRRLRELKLEPTLRLSPGGAIVPYLTDNHCEILDCRIPDRTIDPAELEAGIRSIRGVVESGLFVRMTNRVYVGTRDGRVEELRPATEPGLPRVPADLRDALLQRIEDARRSVQPSSRTPPLKKRSQAKSIRRTSHRTQRR